MRPDLKILFLGTAKGGSGKTTVADALAAGAAASNLKTLVVDVDDGNSGFRRRAGKKAALPLGWDAPVGSVDAWIASHLADVELAIFDLGANVTASQMPVTEFLGGLVIKARAAGASIIFMPIASPNAPGTDRLVSAMRDDFERLGDVRVVENDVDGSGEFLRPLAIQGYSRISFPHIDPGVQAVRMQWHGPLIEMLKSPPPGYKKSSARLAKFVHRFLAQDGLKDIIPSHGVEAISALGSAAPSQLRYKVPDIRFATDRVIAANEALCEAWNMFKSADRRNREAVCDAALHFLEAEDTYRAAPANDAVGPIGSEGALGRSAA